MSSLELSLRGARGARGAARRAAAWALLLALLVPLGAAAHHHEAEELSWSASGHEAPHPHSADGCPACAAAGLTATLAETPFAHRADAAEAPLPARAPFVASRSIGLHSGRGPPTPSC